VNDQALANWLELEDDAAFVELVEPSTGILAWPALRQDAFRLFTGDHLFSTAPVVDLTRRPGVRRIAVNAARAVAANRRQPIQPSDVLFVGTGAGLMPRHGSLFNRHIDYFAGALPGRTWTAEALFGDRWPAAPRANRRLTLLATQRLLTAFRARVAVRTPHRVLARALVEAVVRQGRDRLDWVISGERRELLEERAARRFAAYPVQAGAARALLRKVNPRLALVEEGCYGHMAVFNAVARDAGVHVAEFQHGMVTRSHDAYNVHPRLAASEAYRRTQPAGFLAYGAWWARQVTVPLDDRAVIGNPHRTAVLTAWQPDPDRRRVIVLGDAIETDAYLAFCRQLAGLVGSSPRVSFRPHPIERERVAHVRDAAFDVDTEPDLYRSLASGSVVAGEASTALFEAAGLVPSVLVWDTPKSRFHLGPHPFPVFRDVVDLADRVRGGTSSTQPTDLATGLWAGSWRERFLRYVADHT
jgi:hypothetical protein